MNKSIVSFILSGTLILGSLQDISALNTCTDSIISVGESNSIVKKINGNELSKSRSSILRNPFIISSILGGTLGIGTIGTIATILALKACASNVTSTEQTNSVVQNINTHELSTTRKNVVEEENVESTEQQLDGVLENTDTNELSYEYTYGSSVEKEDSEFTEQSDDALENTDTSELSYECTRSVEENNDESIEQPDDALENTDTSELSYEYTYGSSVEKEDSEFTEQLDSNDDLLVSPISRLDSVGRILERENSLLRIRVNQGQNVYMVGDIHGDLKALDFVLEFMSNHPNDKFVFLGDYVDRGNCGEEVFLKLAKLKINNPNKVFLLRGNHETKYVNSWYGFMKEIEAKYSYTDYNLIYNKFCEVFNKLPVVAVLDCGTKKIFCVHGGICPSKDNGTLNVSDLENLLKIEPREKSIMESLLWSDPNQDENQSQFIESLRGAGYMYSKKNVTDFLRKNRLDCIVRAHETVDGIKENFGGTVKTVFSAPHYCGRCDNSGAILGFDNTNNNFEVIKFNRSTQPNSNSYVQVN